MDKPDKEQDQESARYDELADKVDELSRERASLEQRIRELEMRVTGAYGKDEMTYNFIVEKQTTQMQWSHDRDSSGSPKRDGRDKTHYRNAMTYPHDVSRNASFISGASATQQPPKGAVLRIEQLANKEQHPRAVFGENGELFIVYSPTASATKVGGTDGGSDDGIHERGLRRREASKTAPADLGTDGESDDGIRARGFRRREVQSESEATPSNLDDHDGDSTQVRIFRHYLDEEPKTRRSAYQDDLSKAKAANRGGPEGNKDDGIQARGYRRDLEDQAATGRLANQDDNLNKPSSRGGPEGNEDGGIQARGYRRDLEDQTATGRSATQDDDNPSSRGGPEGNEDDGIQARGYRRDLEDQTATGRSANQDDNLNKPSSRDGAGNIQVDGLQTRGLHGDSDGHPSRKTASEGNNLNKSPNKEYTDLSPYEINQYDKSRAGQQQGLAIGREPMLPQVIVVTGLRHSDLKHDLQECSDEDETGCNCYQIMKESEEWKANVTKLLELLVINAYDNRCPRSLIKALMEPSTREQAIAELLDRTFPASDNTVSQDNISKMNNKDRSHNKDTSVSSLLNKNKADARTAADNKKDTQGMTRTFAQYPPYPPASFESKESLPRQTKNRQGASSNKTPTHSTQQGGAGHSNKIATPTTQQGGAGHSNKIDIVCPPGSRPIIHIPPSGMPAVTCNNPPRAQECSAVACCSPKNPCTKHKKE